MPARTLPNLGLQAFFNPGESGWDDEVSLNFLLLSVLVQGGVLETVSADPGSPANGDVYLFADDHPGEPNKIAIRDDGEWIFVTPQAGWRVYDRDADVLKLFNGTIWTVFSSGGASLVSTQTGTSADLDPSHANGYRRWTSTGAKTLTVQPNATVAQPANGEWHIRNAAASGNLTIAAGSGVTISAPTGGTLVVAPGGTVTLKRVAENVFDLMGQVVAV